MTIKDMFTIETYEQYKLDNTELTALKNLIVLARERLWLADAYPSRPPMSLEFDEELADDQINTCRESIDVLNRAISRYTSNEK
jgi:hypothetical protein